MSLSKNLFREYEVAFSKNAQPWYVRVIKYAIVVAFGIFFWESKWYWIALGIALILSLVVDFWYRYKTKAWTQSFGGWDYELNKPVDRQQ